MANNDNFFNGGITDFGIATDAYEGIASIHKFGMNTDIDVTAELIWDYGVYGGITAQYTYPTSAETLYLSSAAAADTSKSIVVRGLDTNWNLQTETVATDATNGRVAVTLANQYRRVYRAYVAPGETPLNGNIYIHVDSNPGADGIPDGGISDIRAFVNGVAVAAQPVLQQTQICIFTVPAGYTALLVNFATQIHQGSSGAANEIVVWLRIRDATIANAAWRVLDYYRVIEGVFPNVAPPSAPLARIPEKYDIEVQSQGIGGGVGNNSVSAQFGLVLVSDDQMGTGGIANL